VPAPRLQDITTIQPAERAFACQLSAPYTLHYVRIIAGQPTRTTSILLVQRSATHFTRYTYQGQQLDSIHLAAATWQPFVMRLSKGHYVTLCESISTAPTHSTLLVKQRDRLVYSLLLTDYYAPDFTAADRVHLAPALKLMRRLMN
jgi:hypothetical protein